MVRLLQIAALLAASALLAPLTSAPAEDGAAAATAAVVRVTAEDPLSHPLRTGTGFVIDPKGLVATCAHVVEGAAQITVDMQDRAARRGRVVGVDQEHDLAILEIPAFNCRSIRGFSHRISEGRAVAVSGYSGEASGRPGAPATTQARVATIRSSKGFVRGTSMRLIQLDKAVPPGNSGGPVYYPGNGEVVGVICSAVGYLEDRRTPIDLAVPASYLQELYQDVLEGRTHVPPAPLPPPEPRAAQEPVKTLSLLPEAAVAELPLLEANLPGGGLPVKPGGGRMLLDEPRGRLYVAEEEANALTVLSTRTFACERRLSVGSRPVGLALSPDGTELYLTLAGGSQLSVFDAPTLRLKRAYRCPFQPYDAVCVARDLLYLTSTGPSSRNGIYLVNPLNGEYRGVGGIYSDSVLVGSKQSGLVLAGETHLSPSQIYHCESRVDPASFKAAVGHGDIGSNLQDLCLSPDGTRVYVCCGAPYHVQVLDTKAFASVGQLPTGPYPRHVAVSADGSRVYATHWEGHVDVFDAASFTRLGSLPVKGEVVRMVCTAGGMLVVEFGDGLWFIDLATTTLEPAK